MHIALTPEDIQRAAEIGSTDEDIALLAGCGTTTLQGRFADHLAIGRARRRHTLLRLQYELAESKNPTMLIWLGKNGLGQTDHATMDLNRADIGELNDEELERVAAGVPIRKVLAARANRA